MTVSHRADPDLIQERRQEKPRPGPSYAFVGASGGKVHRPANANGGGTTPRHTLRSMMAGLMGRPTDARLPVRPSAYPFRLQDEVAGMELDGLRQVDLHLGIGIGVG